MKTKQYIWLAVVALLLALSWIRFQDGSRSRSVVTKPSGTSVSPAGKQPLLALAHAKKRVAAPVSVPDQQFPWRLRNTARSVDQLARDKRSILLRNALIDTAVPGGVRIPANLRSQGDPGSYLIQSRGPLDASFKSLIEGVGGKVISYIPNDAYLVQIDANALSHIENNPKVQAILPYEPYYKLDQQLLLFAVNDQPVPYGQPLRLTVFPGGADAVTQFVQQLGGQVLAQDMTPFGPELITRMPPDKLVQIAQNPGVQAIGLQGKKVILNDLTRPRLGVTTDGATPASYQGLTGTNVLVDVNDTSIDGSHPDLTNRVFPGAFTAFTNDTVGHGTHVAGIIGSSGDNGPNWTQAVGSTTNANYRGMAPSANFLALDFNQYNDGGLFETAARSNLLVFNRTNALISNNSWGYIGEYDYSASSAIIDAAVRDAVPGEPGEQPMIVVFSAGNAGSADDGGQGGVGGTVTAPGNAKNVITVGALENYRDITNTYLNSNGVQQAFFLPITDSSNQVASFSSRGNVSPGIEGAVGRFKPDVVAPGTMVISTRSGQWDTNEYYNITNVSVVIYTNLTLAPNDVYSDVIDIPANTVSYNVTLVPISPVPFPGVPVYTNTDFNPSSGTTNYAGTNSFGATNTDAFFVSDNFLFYDFVNTNTAPILFDVIQTIVTTNQAGFYYAGLQDLNEKIGPYYRYESGTSMSAPAVSGMLALMQEFFEANGRTNSPALMKALLINGAISLNPNYDRNFATALNAAGWGLASLTNSLPAEMFNNPANDTTWPTRFLDQDTNRVLSTGDRHTYDLSLNTGASVDPTLYPVKITLVWTDPAGNPVAGIKLVNDLDLIVSNRDNGKVYYGNAFIGGSDYSVDSSLSTNAVGDVINNVENVYLPPGAGTHFDVIVYGKRVNVNAVTANTNAVVQDYALVVTAGPASASGTIQSGSLSPTPLVTSTPLPNVTYLTADNTGSPLLNQRVGANASVLTSTNGTNTQWVFYVVTNNTANTNVAFVTFLTPNLASPTRNDSADIDLYVSTDSDLTNLVDSVVNASFKSVGRGGTEAIVFTNSAAGTVYYVGVKAEDQEGADFGFFSVATDGNFSQQNADGSVDIFGVGLPAPIPDGDNATPGTLRVFGIGLQTIPIRRVVVTNVVTHQRFSDLEIGLQHGGISTPLKLHDSSLVPDANGTYTMIFDDSQQNDVANAVPPDYPGTLSGFIGQDGVGVWTLEVGDYAPDFTGTVDSLIVHLDRQSATNAATSVTVLANSYFFDFIDVPVGATELTINVFNIIPADAPIEIFIRKGQLPTPTVYDKMTTVTNGGSLTLSVFDTPPLTPGRYYVAFYNPNSVPVSADVSYDITISLAPAASVTYTNYLSAPIKDDAETVFSTNVFDNRPVASVEVGVRIQHPRASDLVLRLESPSGTSVLLAENRGGLSTNGYGTNDTLPYVFTTFTEDTNLTTIPIKFDSPPFLGTTVTTNFTNYGTPVLVSTNYYAGGGAAWGYGIGLSGNSVFVGGRLSNNPAGPTALIMSYPVPTPDNATVNWLTNAPDSLPVGDTNSFFSISADAGSGVYAAGISLSLTVDTNGTKLPKGFTTQFSLTGPSGGATSGANWLTQTPANRAFGQDEVESLRASTVANEGGNTYVYVSGSSQYDSTGVPNITDRATLVKLDTSGAIIWQTNDAAGDPVSSDPTQTSFGYGVAAYNGNLFVAGSHAVGGVQFPYLRKFASDGTPGVATVRGFSGQYNGITVFGTNIYAVGSDANGDARVDKYDENLNLLWTRAFDVNGQSDVFYAAVGVGNRLYAVGSTAATPGVDDDVFILELNPDSGMGLSQTFYGGSGSDIARGVTTDGTDLYVVGESSSYGGGLDHSLMLLRFSVATSGNTITMGYVLPEESLAAFNGENAGGTWKLKIVDNRVGPIPAVPDPELLGWTLNINLATTNAAALPLTSGTPLTLTVESTNWSYFVVNVPVSANFATNTLVSLSGGGLDWYFNQFRLPTGTNAGDFAFGTNVTSSVKLLDTVATAPQLVPGQRYYLGVRNSDPLLTNQFAIEVDFDQTNISTLSVQSITASTPVSGTAASPSGNGSITSFYQFDIPANSSAAMFEVYDTTGSTLMLLRRGTPPTTTDYDYSSTAAAGNVQRIVLRNNSGLTDISGHWYLAVLNGGSDGVQFNLSASVSQNGLLVSALPLEINQTPTVLPDGRAQIVFTAISGELYQIQYSTDLMNWSVLQSVQTSSGQIIYTDPNANKEMRFYRVVQLPQ